MGKVRDHLRPYIVFARVELGMLEAEFLQQTPKEWEEMMEAWLKRERRKDYRFARVCLVIAKVNGSKGLTEDDFVPRTPQEVDAEDEFEKMAEVLNSLGK